MPVIVVSLGGEGEPVVGADLVINVNLFRPDVMIRPGFAADLASDQVAVATSAGSFAFRDASVDMIVARRFPIQFDHTVDGFTVSQIAVEAFRVATQGAVADIACSSCDLDSLARALSDAGFVDIVVDRRRYSVDGRKP